jgi:hypothetical protein
MSLVFVVKVPAGLVLAAESRSTVMLQDAKNRTFRGTYDNTPKLLSFKGHNYVGAVTCGLSAIGLRAIHTYIPEFEEYLQPDSSTEHTQPDRLSIFDFSKKLSDFFAQQWGRFFSGSTRRPLLSRGEVITKQC